MRRALVVVAALVLGGCGAGAAPPPVAPRPTATRSVATAARPGTTEQITCDASAAYRNLGALRQATESVVVFRASGEGTARRTGGVPVTTTPAVLLDHLSGRRVPTSFAVRQTGAVDVTGCETLVTAGRLYLAYLVPFRRRPGGPIQGHQYFAAGLFEARGSVLPPDSTKAFVNVTIQQPSLPHTVSIAQVRRS